MTKKPTTMNGLIFNRLLIFLSVFFVVVNVVVFSIFSISLNETSFSQNQEIAKQINYNYENYFSGIIESSNNIIDSLADTTINDTDEILEIFEFSLKLHQDIKNITLYYKYDQVVTGTSYDLYYSDETWYDEAYNDSTTYIYKTYYNDETQEYNAYIAHSVDFYSGIGLFSGVILIEMDFDTIIELANNSNLGENGHITIIDTDNNIIFSSITNSVEEENMLSQLILGIQEFSSDENNFQVYLNTLTYTPWRIAVFSNIDNLSETQTNFVFIMIILTLLSIFISSVICYSISESVTSPLRILQKRMIGIEESSDLLTEVDLETNLIEVAMLVKQFNNMLLEINDLMEQVIVEQKSQRMSELKSLQNQINPHFLYNTLDSIVWLAENNENEKVVEMTVALARLFRISISRGNFIIPVKDELDHAKCYLIIQSIRYVNAFDYTFEIDDSILKIRTMKLILQPLIENAIYHGLRNRVDRGLIIVKAYQDDENIIFEVSDNGYGIRPQKIEELYNTFKNPDLNDGVGIKNVYQRLMIYFNGHANLQINSELDEGTTIKIILPKEEIVDEKDNIL